MKNPGVSAVLSFFCPGLGHIYNGQIIWGLIFIIIFIISIGLCSIMVGFVLAPIIWLFAMFDAYSTAKKININTKQQEENEKVKCPFCAETIKAEAKVCRFCGKDLPKEFKSNIESKSAESVADKHKIFL